MYFHIPFCTRKCIYCDFYSIEGVNSFDSFLESLHSEIDLVVPPEGMVVSSLFFGGGTPSLLPASDVRKILDHVRQKYELAADAEITLESNPGTLDPDTLCGFRESGINRLSIGIQSFDESELAFLGRIHDVSQAVRAVRDAREARFSNVSIDLIYSLPRQTLESWRKTLLRAIDLNPDHISAYSLIVEENTPLSRLVRTGQVTPLPVETEARFFDETVHLLASSGYEQYEVSNFAKPGFRSVHNMSYWQHRNYIGFGPSAHSFWSDRATGTARRWWNIANVGNYADRLKRAMLPIAGEETLSSETLMVERLFLGLRSGGVDLHRFRADFGEHTLARQESLISELLRNNLVTLDDGTLRSTTRGYLLCDEMSARLTA